MKYILKFTLQTIVVVLFILPTYILYTLWYWEIPDGEVFKLYIKSFKRLVQRLTGRYQSTSKVTTY